MISAWLAGCPPTPRLTLLCMGLSRFVPLKASWAHGSRSVMGTRPSSPLPRLSFGGGMWTFADGWCMMGQAAAC